MPTSISDLFAHNRAWAAEMERERPGFFTNLKSQQKPKYMWIGCSDSRVPANQITGLEPGEVFVHRNVANVVVHSDLNALSTIQFAVEMLKVEHVMVVGHYGCGGVQAALDNVRIGLADNWIRHIQDVRDRHRQLRHLPPGSAVARRADATATRRHGDRPRVVGEESRPAEVRPQYPARCGQPRHSLCPVGGSDVRLRRPDYLPDARH